MIFEVRHPHYNFDDLVIQGLTDHHAEVIDSFNIGYFFSKFIFERGTTGALSDPFRSFTQPDKLLANYFRLNA
jgi:hypothetical protein